MIRSKLLLLVVILALSMAAACSPNAATTMPEPPTQATQAPAPTAVPLTEAPSTPTMQPAAAPAADFPLGKYVSVKDKSVGYLFNADGSFAFYYAAKDPVFIGKYTLEGSQITIVDPNETNPECMQPAAYQWTFDGENLTFAPTSEDTCRGRREANADTYRLDRSWLPEITIDAADYSYSAPEMVSAGWVRVILTNSGTEPHHVQFMRLKDGVSVAQFEEALKQGEGPAMALVQQVGGVGAIAPTMTASAVLNLAEGQYVILCLIPSPGDGAPHFVKGMINSLTVQAAEGAAAGEPSASLAVRLQDYSFEMPAALPAGPLTIQVTNDGPEPHEFNILKLTEGKTVEDVINFLNAGGGPPPFIPVGGMNGLDVGATGYAELNLEAGEYVAICNIPSPKAEGDPHFALGMFKQFSVTAETASSFPTGKFVSVNDKAKGYQFNADGTFGYYLGGVDPVVQGTYSVVGNLLSVRNPDETDPQCQGSVTYQWFFDGEKLTFSPMGDDTCRPRRDSFGDTYIKS